MRFTFFFNRLINSSTLSLLTFHPLLIVSASHTTISSYQSLLELYPCNEPETFLTRVTQRLTVSHVSLSCFAIGRKSFVLRIISMLSIFAIPPSEYLDFSATHQIPPSLARLGRQNFLRHRSSLILLEPLAFFTFLESYKSSERSPSITIGSFLFPLDSLYMLGQDYDTTTPFP